MDNDIPEMNIEGIDVMRVNALAAGVVALMVRAMNGEDGYGADDDQLPWGHAVFAATLAIKAVAGMVEQSRQLDNDSVKLAVMSAITTALLAPVMAMQVDSREEFDALVANMRPDTGARH